jgi:hypothetical protein
MPTRYYRYISSQSEVRQVLEERIVESANNNTPYTWFTPTRYEDPQRAKEELALPRDPHHRVGPLHDVQMPSFNQGPRKIQPNFGEPGGGVEVCTTESVPLFGLWNFQSDDWKL